MGLLERIFGRVEKRSTLTSWDLMTGRVPDTGAGVAVTPVLAENLSAVFACTQIIAETVATLPPVVYRKTGDGKEPDPGHPVARLFNDEPNSLQTPVEFLEQMTAHVLLRGNAYAEIVRDARGAPAELIPLHPDRVSVLRVPGTLRILYDVSDMDGGTRRLVAAEIFHLRDRSDDLFVGKSRLARARETFSIAEATERFAASTYRNSARLSGVLSTPEGLSDTAVENIKNSFAFRFGGADKAGILAVLEEGLKWQSISVSPQDAEMLASRRFSVEQIARIFRVPPPVIGDLTHGTYSNVEELGRWFAMHTVSPWLCRWESAIEKQLFSEAGRRDHTVEFDTDELLRGDQLKRFQCYRIGREIGLYSANELRTYESLNKRGDPDTDAYLSPLNMSVEQANAPKQ
jgi:HK97 family phage portal protein